MGLLTTVCFPHEWSVRLREAGVKSVSKALRPYIEKGVEELTRGGGDDRTD